MTRKPKETTKYKYVYKTNINTLIGNIKEELPRLLTDNQEEIQIIVKEDNWHGQKRFGLHKN